MSKSHLLNYFIIINPDLLDYIVKYTLTFIWAWNILIPFACENQMFLMQTFFYAGLGTIHLNVNAIFSNAFEPRLNCTDLMHVEL